MDKQPTQEQIKEFWEWCGQECRQVDRQICGSMSKVFRWFIGLEELEHHLDESNIDLNNLFKYAVPKLNMPVIISSYLGETEAILPSHFPDEGTPKEDLMSPPLSVKNDDPALALFWAIWEVIRDDHTSDQSIR